MVNNIFSFVIVFLLLVIITTTVWSVVMKEHYEGTEHKNKHKIVKQYFDELGIEGLQWRILKEEEYNDRLSLVDVKVEGAFAGILHFTIEKYKTRDEFRLVSIENVKEHKWKHKLNNKSFCLSHHSKT